jgi:hypothetical protein
MMYRVSITSAFHFKFSHGGYGHVSQYRFGLPVSQLHLEILLERTQMTRIEYTYWPGPVPSRTTEIGRQPAAARVPEASATRDT